MPLRALALFVVSVTFCVFLTGGYAVAAPGEPLAPVLDQIASEGFGGQRFSVTQKKMGAETYASANCFTSHGGRFQFLIVADADGTVIQEMLTYKRGSREDSGGGLRPDGALVGMLMGGALGRDYATAKETLFHRSGDLAIGSGGFYWEVHKYQGRYKYLYRRDAHDDDEELVVSR